MRIEKNIRAGRRPAGRGGARRGGDVAGGHRPWTLARSARSYAGHDRRRRRDAGARSVRRLRAGRGPAAAHRARAGRSRRPRHTVVARLTPAAPPLLDPRTRAELNAAIEAARAAGGEARARRDRAAATLERARALRGGRRRC